MMRRVLVFAFGALGLIGCFLPLVWIPGCDGPPVSWWDLRDRSNSSLGWMVYAVIAAYLVGALVGLEGRMTRALATIATAAFGFVFYVFGIILRSGGFGGLPHTGMMFMVFGAIGGFLVALSIALRPTA